jgi:uncharacterized protein YjiS (DUF1127 family)
MTALSMSFATDGRRMTLRGAPQLQPVVHLPSTLALLAELQHGDDSVGWVLALYYEPPMQVALSAAMPVCSADSPIGSDGVENGSYASGPGIILNCKFTVVGGDAIPSRRSGWLYRLIAAVADAWAVVRHERQIHQSAAAVYRMDDRTPKDIGIDRGEIERLVRHGRAGD